VAKDVRTRLTLSALYPWQVQETQPYG